MSLLECRQVCKNFGTLAALANVCLTVGPGEVHGLIGPNGSGKSTLLRCIAGAESCSAGSITLGGDEIGPLPPSDRVRAGLSLKFQITAVLPELSVYDNILLALQAMQSWSTLLFSRSRSGMHAHILDTLNRFNLKDHKDALAGHLPHGQQQWLEIAMAMASEPRLLLLDEPTAGMSPQERRATGELLLSFRQQCSILIVEHDLDFIRDICDTITVLDQGATVASGPKSEVQADPRVTAAYLNHG